jgi:hypothetical protein
MFPRSNLLTRLLKRTKKKRTNEKSGEGAKEVTNSENSMFDGKTKVKTMEETAPTVTGTAPTDEE